MKQLVQLIRNNARREPARIAAENEPDTLFLYDVIDPYWGIGASDFNKALAGMAGKKVTLRVNCPGGDVFDGRAMAAAIAQHGDVHAVIEGVAASAATFVTAACASITIAKGALYMIHNAWTMAYGNKSDLRQTAELLETIDGTILDDYERLTGQPREQL
ncbi:head maturation protease, ClpP-related, partial [Massilia sp. Leaf139]|uniref:head maturation protease, ClpP-related n=1 Tax=Massilia sp. Leaf139 TaxID=1736272 RepID=UPI0035A62121